MIRRLSLIGCVLAASLALPAGASAFAREAIPGLFGGPTVTFVTPSRVPIGNLMVLRGHGFTPGRHRNVVFFSRPGVRPLFATADVATDRTVIVRITQRLLPYLSLRQGTAVFTRFRVRVLSDQLGPYWTAYKRSPLIGPSGEAPAVRPIPAATANTDGAAAQARAAVAAVTAAALPDLPSLPSACSLNQALRKVDTSPAAVGDALAPCNS